MAPSPVKIRADCDLNCFTTEGIDAIKHALITAKAAVSDEHIQVAVSINSIMISILINEYRYSSN